MHLSIININIKINFRREKLVKQSNGLIFIFNNSSTFNRLIIIYEWFSNVFQINLNGD